LKREDEKKDTDKRVDKNARDNAQRYYKAGVKYGRAGLFRQARESFEQAIKSDPGFGDAYYGLGHALFDLGQYKESIAAFEKSTKINPQNNEAYTFIGQAYAKLRENRKTGDENDNGSPAAEPVSLTASEKTTSDASSARNDPTRIYRVGVGDVLDIHIPGAVKDDSTLYTVSGSGDLEHPLLGRAIRVQGLTTEEITTLLSTELKRRSIQKDLNPSVAVRDYNSHTILVSGLVKETGTKILRREAIPLYVVLADAQPLPEAEVVTVLSQRSLKSRTIELSNADQTNVLVAPGDVVTVQAGVKQFFYVGGEVKSPGELPYRRGLSLTQAILSAGGVKAKGEKIQLTRGQPNGLLATQEYKLSEINRGKVPDPLIEPGDRITVMP